MTMTEHPVPPDAPGPPARRRFPGLAHQIKHARRFVERALAHSPEVATATLLTSELATNAITHSASGTAGGKFEVSVHTAPGWTRVEVRDLGSPEHPRAQHRGPYDTAEHGRGLDMVEVLAAKWGTEHRSGGLGRTVWYEMVWEAAEETGPAPEPEDVENDPETETARRTA
ncbi:ATP-binding protein [Nocardiopsis baichengensis]|uniref:ATP-binding protein n=1 Tax=Nocardiopsis baichengensis TaxID=280240 RepID=UPI00037C0F1A|nr:ATP-binding protein [Nocardiopsis baichengensis]